MPAFRDFPGSSQPPDPAEWEKQHGTVPRRLDAIPAKFVTRAAAAIAQDDSTLDADAALAAKTLLDAACERAKGYVPDAAEDDLVFYRPDDGHFWLYPAK